MRRAWLGLVHVLAGCPGPTHPHGGHAPALDLEIGRPGASLHGVAGDGERLYAALTIGERTTVEARRGAIVAWTAVLDGGGGPLARTGDLLIAALATRGPAVRGDPGAAITALDATTGAVRWRVTLDATRWALIAALAPTTDGVIVGGSFAGSLRAEPALGGRGGGRAGAHVVESAGESDGFVAHVTAAGQVAWLIRFGGPLADAVQGVAAGGDRIAIAGTFTAGADLLGQPLPAFDEHSVLADGFVAELDARGAHRWAVTFGGKEDDRVAGVAIDARGRVIVAATVRDVVHVGTAELVARGAADGLVAWFTPGGDQGPSILLGGADFDGLRAITAAGDRVVVAGFFSGSLPLGGRTIAAGGGDDAFLAALDPGGGVAASWQVGGVGREEITALALVPGGVVAGIAHTASATVDGGTRLPSPTDPMTGAALVVRPLP